MDELFRPSAVPVKGESLVDYHDAANPNDDPQIEATRRPPPRQRARPRRRISVTEREEQAAAAATNTASAEAPSLQQLNKEEDLPSEVPTSSADSTSQRAYNRSIASMGSSSVAFSYKDLYGSDDELDLIIAKNNDWKNKKQQQQQSDDYESSAAGDVVEFAQDETNFSNKIGRRLRRTDTSESGLSGYSSGHGGSMVSVNMAPDNKNSEFDSIGGLISDLDDYYNQTPKQNGEEGNDCGNGQISYSESVQGTAKHADEPHESLLKSAVESLKQLPLFRSNSAEQIPATRPHHLRMQRLDGELVKQENNHADESDHSDAGSVASPRRPLHVTQPEATAKPTDGPDDNSLSHVSDPSKNHRKSSGGMSFFDRFQKQNFSKHDTDKSEDGATPTSKQQDVDDDTPSTNSISCHSPDLAPNAQVGEEAAQLSLLESMAREVHLESNGMDSNSQPIESTSQENKGALDESLTEIFSAALDNDENGAREIMGEEKKAVIIDQLQLLAKKDSVRSLLREKQGDDDASSGTPRFRPSIVEDFINASKRQSFHLKMSNEGSQADSQDTLDWPSPVSSLGSPHNEEHLTQNEDIEDESIEADDAEQESDSPGTRSMRSKGGSIELDLSGRYPETSNVEHVEHGDSLQASIEWPTLDTSNSKRSCDDSIAHKNAISKTASARSLVQSLRQSSLKAAMMNETKPETESTTEAVVESSAEVKAECSGEVKAEHFNADERTGTNQDAELHRPSNSSSRPSNSSSHPSNSSSRPSNSSSRMSSSQSSYRSPKLWGRNRRATMESDASMSSLESFASATNRASKTRGNLPSVKSQESMSSFGSVTSGLYQNEDKKEGCAENQEEFTVSITDLNESPGNVVTYPLGTRHLSRNSFKAEKKVDRRTSDGSLCIDDFDGNSTSSGRVSMGRQQSGLANDVPLLLSSATSLISHYSTDGIEHIDPSAADSDDFDFAMNAYANGIKYGHFDIQADLNAATEDNDHLLAAKAYMGLGFARQCKGELASSLDAYMKALDLCNAEIGHDDPINANLEYACGNVLNEMDRNLEASTHFRRALNFYKSRESDGNDAQVNILFIEGMMYIALEDTQRALDCFREGLRLNQTSQRPLNLKLASVMYEMGSIYSQKGEYMDSAQYFNVALHVRKSNLGDSFVVARTHYSLGVTLASQEVLTNTTTDAFSHLETALRICQQEFKGDNLQTAVILHALGVLNERKGIFHTASSWFEGEREMLIALFGNDHSSVASISSDLGTCFYNVGKYESARNMFQDALRIMTLSKVDEVDRRLEVADLLYKIASCHDSLCDFDKSLATFYKAKEIRQYHFGMENGLVIQTMLRIGNVLLCKGEASAALNCFGEVLGIGYASDSINEIEIANALYGRGCAQFCGYQLSDAMKSFHDSLNWKLAKLGENDPGLACIFYQMAHVHLQQSEDEEALTYFEEYVRLLELDPQLNLHEQAQICFTKGIIAKMKENFEAALSLYGQALHMFDILFDGKHEKIASIHFDIGCVRSELGHFRAALHHFGICLSQRREWLGFDHVDVADVLLHMASIYTKENDFELAAKCLQDSDEIWKSKLENSEKLLSVLMISGKRWKAIHRYEETEANFEQALEMAITLHGQKHELVADILLDLGEFLQEISQAQQAFFCFDESIEIRSALFGADSPSVAKAEYSKGVAHIFQGQFDEAAACLNRALTIRQEKLGRMDSAVGDTLNTIGFLQLKMGNINGRDALDPLMEALEIRRSVGNKGKVVSTLQNILSLYKKRKDYESCIEVNSDILVVRQDDFGPAHERVAEAWINLGSVQASAGKFVEARASYEEALRVRSRNHGYQHRLVAQVIFKIGSLSSRQGQFDDAKKFFEEYLRIRAEDSDPDEEMARALTLMGDLQKETGAKSMAQINWMSAIETYQQLGYEDDHKKIIRLQERQKSLGHMIGLFGFGRRESFARRESGDASRRKSSGSVADNLSVLGLKLGIDLDDNASAVSKLTMPM
mmetsp:Transcript_21043/g.42074  ORF Transcript_21043/g.42074 Transcript_21043/m.42074 type:complete len:1988 (-) Transcript_21043:41-6004(-)